MLLLSPVHSLDTRESCNDREYASLKVDGPVKSQKPDNNAAARPERGKGAKPGSIMNEAF